MKTHINKVGFEIEGEFSTGLQEALKDYGGMTGDGSLRRCGREFPCSNLELAEFRSTPYAETEDIIKFFTLFEKLSKKRNFLGGSSKYHWNSSCGFHVHVSFTPKVPVEIWSAEFARYFLKRLRVYFPNELEQRRKIHFCKVVTAEKDIAQRNTGDRYRFINFGPAMYRHGTIEFRIFPAAEPKKMNGYTLFVVESINKFLSEAAARLKKKIIVTLDPKPTHYTVEESVGYSNNKELRQEVIYNNNIETYV